MAILDDESQEVSYELWTTPLKYFKSKPKKLPVQDSKKRLENLLGFKEGAKSDLVPHHWTYMLSGNDLVRVCDNPSKCFREDLIRGNLTREQRLEYEEKLDHRPELFQKESWYCKKASIDLAKKSGTFNPDYKEDKK